MTRCDDEFEVVEEFKMPLEKDAWMNLNIDRELELCKRWEEEYEQRR